MSNAQKEMLEKFTEALKGLPDRDRAYLLGRAEGMAEAMESREANRNEKKH